MKTLKSLRYISALLLLLASTPLFAQQNAQITGVVTDNTGALVPDATVVLTEPSTGAVHSTQTSTGGLFTLPGLNASTYDLKVTAKGFKAYAKSGLVLSVSSTLRSDVKLEIGTESQTVTVFANALQVQSDSNEVSTLINPEQITTLATNGRNVVRLAELGLGVSSNLPDLSLPVGGGSSFVISFNGLNQSHNIWLIDGGEAYDRGSGGRMVLMPSQDALAEFKTLSSNYPPDYGIASGGTISMALKSGTQHFHGSAWEFDRNDAFQAHNYFDNNHGQMSRKPELRLNIFGANIGGPVVIPHLYNDSRQKTFFFYNQEFRRIIQGSSPSPVNAIPVADFITSAQTLNYQIPKFAPAAQHSIYVPTVSNTAFNAALATDGLTPGQPFPNNVIPANLMDPNALAFLATGALPPATTANDAFQKTVPSITNDHEELVRIDHAFNEQWHVFGHYIHDVTYQAYPTAQFGSDSYPTIGNAGIQTPWSFAAKLTGAPTPNILVEAAFYMDSNIYTGIPTGIYAKPTNFGVQPFYTGQNADNRLPTVNLGTFGTSYDPDTWPWGFASRDYSPNVAVSIVHGAHSMKFGVGYNRYVKNQQIQGRTNGDFTFNDNVNSSGVPTTQLSGDSYVDLLLGFASGYNQLQYQDNRHYVSNTPTAYAMDNWHVSKQLSLQYGLRYDAFPHLLERNNRLANFDPSSYLATLAPTINADGSLNPSGPGFQTINGTPFYLNGIDLAGQYGTPRGLVNNDYKTLQPRVGFSYDVTGKGKTVLRGGFGAFYEREEGNDTFNVAPAPPFSNTPAATNVLFSNPSTTWVTGGTAATPTFPQGITAISKRYPAPGVAEYSLGVQQEIRPSLVLAVQYVGNLAWHQNVVFPINNYPLSTPLDTRWRSANFTSYLAAHPGATPLTSAQTEALATYPGWSGISQELNIATGTYNGFQTGLRQDNKHGLSYEIDYTYSHEIDTQSGSSDLGTVSNPWNLKYNKGSGTLDRRHILSINYTYRLPFFSKGSALERTTLGGWTVAGTVIAESGLPWAGSAAPGGGYSDTIGLGGGYTNRPNFSGKVQYPKKKTTVGSNSGYQYVSSAGFSQPTAAWLGGPNLGFGNAGRDLVVGPGRTNFTTALYKSFNITESTHIEFRAESFNTFNHTQFSAFNKTVNSQNFGFVTAAQDPRTFEFGGKFVF